MRFKSTLLSTNNTTNSGLQSLVETNNRPHIYDILEYNSDMQDIDIHHKIIQYRNIVEAVYANDNNQSIALFNENIIKTAIDKLVEIVKKIIEFVKNTINKLFGRFKKEESVIKEEIDRVEAIPKNDPVWEKNAKFKIFCFPNIESVNSSDFIYCLQTFTDSINRMIEGQNISAPDDTTLATSYKALFRKVRKNIKSSREPVSKYTTNVTDNKTLKEYTMTELCFIVTEEMTIRDWYEKYVKTFALETVRKNYAAVYTNAQSALLKELEGAKKKLESAKQKSLSDDIVKKIEVCVNYVENVTNAYNGLISTIQKYHTSFLHYAANVLRNVKSNNDFDNDKYHTYKTESGMIHGEEFNSDTLFDNEDMRDFNRTEWLDLNLTVECFAMKHELTEIRKRIIVKEACILADEEPNKISRLNAMREAEEKKSNNVVMNVINRIKEIFSKFAQAFKEKFDTINRYISDNKEFINKPITIESMSSKGDIVAGMYRCQNNINIIPFNYNAMKGDLVDKKTFFKNKILPDLNKNNQTSKRKINWSDDMDVTTYCKIYFGASMPEENYPACVYTGNELEQNKKNILRFLTDKNISFSAEKDLNNLEHESKRMNSAVSTSDISAPAAASTKSAESGSGTSGTSGGAATSSSTDSTKTESMYYSELYDRWITEADIDVGAPKEGDESVSAPNNGIYNAYRVYMETYKDVILAKMTACEFIISEMKQLISTHSANNGGQRISDGTDKKKK